jgi:hypothetical protein
MVVKFGFHRMRIILWLGKLLPTQKRSALWNYERADVLRRKTFPSPIPNSLLQIGSQTSDKRTRPLTDWDKACALVYCTKDRPQTSGYLGQGIAGKASLFSWKKYDTCPMNQQQIVVSPSPQRNKLIVSCQMVRLDFVVHLTTEIMMLWTCTWKHNTQNILGPKKNVSTSSRGHATPLKLFPRSGQTFRTQRVATKISVIN